MCSRGENRCYRPGSISAGGHCAELDECAPLHSCDVEFHCERLETPGDEGGAGRGRLGLVGDRCIPPKSAAAPPPCSWFLGCVEGHCRSVPFPVFEEALQRSLRQGKER
jgi:hypothetical protein